MDRSWLLGEISDSRTGAGKNKMRLEHLVVAENKKVPKERQRHVKRTWEPA